MIDRLEKSSLVERKQDIDDRRKTLIFLTEKSMKIKIIYEEFIKNMLEIFYKDFSKNEIVQCEKYLWRIYANISDINNNLE